MATIPSSGLLSSFRLRIIVLLITASILAAGSFWNFFHNQVIFGGILLLLTVVAIYKLFSIINKTNNDLTQFLSGVLYNDFESTYRQGLHNNEESQQLYSMFNVITDKFRELRMQKEFQHQYLQSIIAQVDTGLICFDNKGNTLMMNPALKNSLHKSHFPTFKSVESFNPILYQCFQEIQPQEERILKLDIDTERLILSIRLRILKMQDTTYSLFAVQDISRQMDQQEVSAWEKLIRVLTHEIMNSITPITSLSSSMRQLTEQAEILEGEDLKDVQDCIRAIENRSKGLMSFTRAYRQLTSVQQLHTEETDLYNWIQEIGTLYKTEMTKKGIQFKINAKELGTQVTIDQELLSRVLINLLKNAMEAVADNTRNKEIAISTNMDTEGNAMIAVADNGAGIEPDKLTDIFIPFFTTKKDGTGIGLSLSKKIVHAHKGRLTVWSKLGEGTVFTIAIPVITK